MSEENEAMTMDDFSKAVDESFSTFKDEGQANWENLKKEKEEQTVLTVTVDGIVNKGVIANVEGVRGFIPASHLSLHHVDDLNDFLGKEIQVQILDLEPDKNRLLLSARNLLRAKADEEKAAQIASIPVGAVLDGTVDSLQSYGAFIKLENGISGLVHVSQISRKRIKSPAAVLTLGQAVKVKVIAIKDGKLSLSMKALEEGSDEDSAPSEASNDHFKLPKAEEVTTSMGSLLKNIKL